MEENIKHFIQQFTSDPMNLDVNPYINYYKGLNVTTSLGIGALGLVPFIAFLGGTEKTQKGIYPVILFYRNRNIVVLAYGISDTEKPDYNWDVNAISIGELFKNLQFKNLRKKEKSYLNSLVYRSYELDALNIATLVQDLDNLIREYKNRLLNFGISGETPFVQPPRTKGGKNITFDIKRTTNKSKISMSPNAYDANNTTEKKANDDKVYSQLIKKYKIAHAKVPFNGYKELYKWTLITACNGLSNADLLKIIYKKQVNLLTNYDASTLNRTIISNPSNLARFSDILDDLFDESKPLVDRLIAFKQQVKESWPDIVNLPNDNRSASVFLTCKYPQNYTFATWNTVYRYLCKYLGESERTDSMFLPHFLDLLQPLVDLVSEDDELKAMIQTSTSGCIQSDMLTAQTIIYTMLCTGQESLEVANDNDIDSSTDNMTKGIRYWVYAPGPQASRWTRCQEEEIACLAWDDMGDLTQYANRGDMVVKLKEIFNKENVSFKHDSLALWQFCHDLKPGDIIYAKRGNTDLVGRGVVQAGYRFDDDAEEYNHTIKVKWTHVGRWDSPFNLPQKTLTRFDEKDSRISHLENLFINDKEVKQIPFSISKVIDTISSTGLLYDPTLIKRFAFSLMCKPFVILSGLAGSGKTQLAVAFAKAMSESSSQYRIVSVGADWTNREPLLGFPNALQKNEYVRPENGVLQLLIDANENPEKPYFLILDEMNLSYVERYFADFLSVMESHGEIALWEKPEDSDDPTPDSIALPKNLFIIGTINVDETTYMFSPKVLDRANVIEFKISFEEMVTFLSSVGSVDTDSAKGQAADMAHSFVTLAAEKNLESSKPIQETLAGFFKELKAVNAEFGYRSATEIFRFISQAKKNDDTGDKLTDEEILDCAIVQKLLPKLHGSRKKLNEPLNALWKLCMPKDNKDILIDQKLVETAIYKLSADKIARMYQSAQDNGFTSFAEA